MNDYWNELLLLIVRHRGKVVGTLLGLILGWMVIAYGLLKTVFVAICIVVGYILGTRWDKGGENRRF